MIDRKLNEYEELSGCEGMGDSDEPKREDKGLGRGQRYEIISTKISYESYRRLQEICTRRGIKPYSILQNCVNSIIRYSDDRYNLSKDMARVMMMLEHTHGWGENFTFCDIDPRKAISEAVYFVSAEGKRGEQIVMVERPWMGQWTQNMNIQQVFEKVVCKMIPAQYIRMRRLAADDGCHSILEYLNNIIIEAENEEDAAEIRKGFEDCARDEKSGRTQWEERFRRKHHKSVDSESLHFDFGEHCQEDDGARGEEADDGTQ